MPSVGRGAGSRRSSASSGHANGRPPGSTPTTGRPAVAETEEAWDARVKGLLKAELKRRNVSYGQFVEKLAAVGVKGTEPNIRNKLGRGKFTAVFFVQCLKAVGAKSVALDGV